MEILYRDEHLIAVNKRSGVAVHRGWARDEAFAMTLVRDAIGRWVYPVHRLDRGTSGVLMFALSPDAARIVSGRFERGEVEKRYRALVRGSPPEAIVIDHPLRPDNDGPPQPAVTEVVRLAQLGRYAWVEARPRTGRLHQVRRHLKHLSCPIIGDVRYGKGEHNRYFRERFGLHRLALHATVLVTTRVDRDEPLCIEAPVAEELERTIRALEQGPW